MRVKTPPLLLLALLGAGNANAIGLGEITVLSRLGERFRAEVQLIEGAGDNRLLSECFRLSQPIDPEAPVLTHGRLALERKDGKGRLLISSEQAINDPVLQLSLRAGCGAEIVRNYSVLIDLPGQAPAPAFAKRSATDAAAVPPPSSPASAGSRLPLAETRQPSAEGPPRLPRRTPLPLRAPAAGRLAYRLHISGNDEQGSAPADALALRLAEELSSQRSERTSDGQRAVFRMEYRLLTTLYERTDAVLSLAEQVRNLESSLAELQAAAANSARPAVALAPAGAAPQSGRPAAAAPAASGAAAAPAEPGAWWLELAAVLGLIALLTWVLRQRALRPVIAPHGLGAEAAEPSLPPVAKTAAAATVDAVPTVVEPAPPAARRADDTLVVPAVALDGNRHLSGHSQGETVLTESYEFNPVMELADIMLSFGRLKGAAQALQEYIEQNPTEALQPWLKLLDIYRQGEMREDFENLSGKLKQHFNVAPVAWEAAAELTQAPLMPAEQASVDEQAASFGALLPRLPNIAQLPHISEALARSWDSPACLAYLNKLLRDNRNGERRGFGPAAVGELLFLMDLLEKRRKD